jgi:2-polyprenyl-3-methyl-5-hydroxy-6-metoxy-1,4-benzoquinol methylase
MHTEFSKPSADIRKESAQRFRSDQAEFKRQQRVLETSRRFPKRRLCIVCARALKGDEFVHRRNVFIVCSSCGHLQSARVPPSSSEPFGFHTVYPSLSARQYRERKERIYTPKLQWIVRSLRRLGSSPRQLKTLRWVEIGAGAGYFLSALGDYGATNFSGFDSNRKLVAVANRALKSNRVRHEREPRLSKAIQKYPADIYVGFFVLEHVEDAHAFFRQLKRLPKGTVFVFAVPVFGLSVLLDGAFEHNFARQLDGIVHRQLYTDESIRYGVELAGLTIVAEWIFGQDADDLSRFLLQNLERNASTRWFRDVSRKVMGVQDGIQQVLDRARLADQRHVIAIKR